MAYTPYYATWHDDPTHDTPIIAAALNNIETGLTAAAATADAAIPKPAAPSTNQALVWNGSAWVADSVKNANIDAAAAIAVSKLAAGSSGQILATSGGSAAWVSMDNALLSSVYSVTWGNNGGTDPVIGDGTIEGYYQRVGRLVTGVIGFTWGSTTSCGAGNFWTFSLPVTGAWLTNPVGGGAGYAEDFATLGYAPVTVRILGTTTIAIYSSASLLHATSPFTWGVGDYFSVSFSYLTA